MPRRASVANVTLPRGGLYNRSAARSLEEGTMATDKKRIQPASQQRRSPTKERRGTSSTKGQKGAQSLYERKDMISLSEDRLSVKRGSGVTEQVAADDLVLEGLIQRALGGRKLRDVKDLYRLCDALEASPSRGRDRRPNARKLARVRPTLVRIIGQLRSIQDELLALGLAQSEDGSLKAGERITNLFRRPLD